MKLDPSKFNIDVTGVKNNSKIIDPSRIRFREMTESEKKYNLWVSDERLESQRNDILLSAPKVENGRLTVDKDIVAQSKGFIDAMDEVNYKAKYPEMYEASGGIKIIKPGAAPSGAPFTAGATYDSDYAKNLSSVAVKKIENQIKNTDANELDGIIKTLSSGEWQSADTMKKYSDTINTYVNDYIALNELGYFNHLPQNERKQYVDSLKSLKEFVNSSKDAFADYKDAESYKAAIQNLSAYDEVKNANPQAVREEINKWQNELDVLEKGKEWLHGDWRRDSDGNYTTPYSATSIPDFVGKTIFEIRSMVSQKREFLRLVENEAKIIDLAKKAQSAVDFKEVSSYKVCNSENELLDKYDTEDFDSNNLDLLVDYLCTDSKEVRDSITIQRYTSYLEMYGVKAAESVNLLSFDWAQQGYDQLKDEEKRIVKYYAKTDVEKLYEYLELNKTTWKSRGSKIIAENIDGNILAQASYAIAGAGDRIMQSVVGFGNYIAGNETYVEPTKTQLTSQYVRQNLEGFGALAYDAVDTFTYMTPSILMNAVLPGSGFAVTGITAAGGAYNDGINMGMTASQARTYGTLIGIAEVGLEKLFSGVAGLTGKITGKSVEKVVAGINSGIIKFVATVGVNAASEGFEEFAQEVLEPLFENIALGYNKNSLDDIDWDTAVYSGLLGMFMGSVSNIGPAAVKIAFDGVNSKLTYGQSQKITYALVDNGLAMPKNSEAYKLAVKSEAKLKNGKSLSGTALYNLATAIESEIDTKSEARLSELGVDKKTAKELSPIVAKAVFGEKLSSAEHSTLNNSEIAVQVVKELSADRANTIWKDAIKSSRINNVDENNAVTEQGDVLQSSATDVVDSVNNFNYNDNSIKEGEYSGIYQGQGLGSSDEETSEAVDSGKEEGVGGIYGETTLAFQRRTKETYGKYGRTVSHLNISVAYKAANVIDVNSPAGMAYSVLKSKGYNVVYCDGPILINNNRYTVERTEAVTIFDGTIYISSNSTLNGKGMALHEAVHVWQYGNNVEYSNYESVVLQEIDPMCEVYKKVASQINDNHYNGRYDIEDINSFEHIIRELTAYISQYVCINPKFAREKFAGMFENWENVVQAVYNMNDKLGFGDVIKEATAEMQVAFLNSNETQTNEIDTDEFIKGMSGEDSGYSESFIQNGTNAVTNPLSSYAPEKRGMIIDFLNSVDEKLKAFVERVKNGSNKFERFTISDVSDREAADIKYLLGIDVDGYTHNINTNGIRHILKRHGISGSHDHTMSNNNDIARMGWVIKNYDSVEVLFEKGEVATSDEFRDTINRRAPQIRYSKKINGTYYVVEAVFENNYNKLWVQSAYLSNEKEVVTQVPNAAKRLPMVTSETPAASPTSYEGVTQDPAEGQKDQPHDYARSALASPPSSNNISQSKITVNDKYWEQKSDFEEDNMQAILDAVYGENWQSAADGVVDSDTAVEARVVQSNNTDSVAMQQGGQVGSSAAPDVVEGADGKQYFDDSGDNITKSNVVYDKVNNIGKKEYDKFFFKKPIKVSKKDWSKVNAARLQKYSHYSEGDIPDVDFFRIAEYNKINIAYRYYIRNYDKYNFEVISKIRIKEEENNVETTNTNVNSNGVRHGADSSGGRFAEHGQAIRSDDKLVEWSEESDKGRTVNNGDSDSGRRIDNSDMKTATSETEVAFLNLEDSQTAESVNTNEFIESLYDGENKLRFSKEYVDRLLDSFGITKPGDYIHVQKCVMETLEREGFFTDKENRCTKVVNDASGMVVEINKSGIRETFNLDNFARLGIFKKMAKLGVLRSLPKIVTNARLIADDVLDEHGENANKKFAYFEEDLYIEKIPITVKLSVKKSQSKNELWVHSIYIKNVDSQNVISQKGYGTFNRTINTDSLSEDIIKVNSIYTKENVSDSPASIDSNAEAGQRTVDTINIGANNIPNNVKAIELGQTIVSANDVNTNIQPDNVKAIKSGKTKVSVDKSSLSQNYLNVNVNKENEIDSDEFIKGLYGEENEKKYKQNGKVDVSEGVGAVQSENSADLQLSEPALKDIARAPTAEESIAAAISGEQLDTKQHRVLDFVEQHFPEITLKFSSNMTKNGLWDAESKTLLLSTNQTVAGMYIEVLKHEFMHRLESKRLYQEFKQFLFNKDVTFGVWAKVQCKVHGIELTQNATASEAISKLTEYYHDSVKNDMAIAKKYREAFTMDGAQREMVADFFGEVMFNGKKYRTQTAQALADETFITIFDESERAEFQASSMAALAEIAEYKPNIFQQIVDWVKRIILKLRGTRIKADAILADELERNIKMLEDYVKQVYYSRDTKKAAENGGGVRYSLGMTTDGRIVAIVDNDILNEIDTTTWDKNKKEVVKEITSNALKQFRNGIVVDGITRKVNRTSRREYTRSDYTEKLYNKMPNIFADKMRAADIADDIVVATTNWSRDGSLIHSREDNFIDFEHGTTLIMLGNTKYIAKVVVGITNNGEAVFYDVVDMTPTTFDIKKVEPPTTATTQNAIGDIQEDSTIPSVAQTEEYVKQVYNSRDIKTSTSINFSSNINEYPYSMQTVINDYLNSVDLEFIDFINDARSETNKKRLEYMHYEFNNNINEKVLIKANNILGFDISNYKIIINGESIHHIDKRHGKNGKHDQSMRNDLDLSRAQYIFTNADHVSQAINSSGQKAIDTQYRDKNNEPSKILLFAKKINGTYCIALASPCSNKETLHVKSMYFSKKIEDIQEFDTNSPEPTPKANLEISSKNIIVNEFLDVNKKQEKFTGINNSHDTKKAAENGGEVKYCSRDNNPNSFNPEGATLKQQLNDAYYTSKSFDQRYVYVGRFSQDFINLLEKNKIILHNYPIAMNYRDAYLSMHSKETGKYHGTGINYHNLGITGLQEALESFKNPKHIIKSKKNGKIELALQTVDKKGNNVLSIVAINTVTLNGNKILDAHIVTSAYGKRNIDNYINVAKNEGRLIKHKKEESTQGTPQVQYEGSINANSSHRDIAETAGGVEINSGLSPTDNVSKNSIRNPDENVKQKQLEIIQQTNPMWDDYHTGIRTTDDIHTWAEVLRLNDEREGQFVWGDFSRADAEQALKDGTITVYSSHPIKNGVFVSTSYIQAQEYAGGRNGKVYSKTIPLTDVAWINGDEGQYAEIDEAQKNTAESGGVKYSDRDIKNDYSYENLNSSDYYTNDKIYSYKFLTAQKDMTVVNVPNIDNIFTNKKIDRAKIVATGKENAKNTNGSIVDEKDSVFVTNVYTKKRYRIDNQSIKHGLGGDKNYLITNSRLGMVIGDIVKNAIPINALKNKSSDVEGTFAMVSYGVSEAQKEFISIVTIEIRTGDVKSVEMIESVHSVSGRIKKGSHVGNKPQGDRHMSNPFTTSTISISQLLEIVNSSHQSILSDDVLNYFGKTRNLNGTYSNDVLFSKRDPAFVSDRDTSEPINSWEKQGIKKICNKFGLGIVFEDLREMVHKGEILSPDGYIEKDKGIIHLNLYAENPIGFILKHELTHFGEKSSRYIEFVKAVKKSKLYKKWITEKTGESDVRIAGYKYKQAVASTHSDIYGAADPKAEAEMIADFVGDMLFTENGSGMAALASDLDTKQRNAVIQFVLDFISWIKKKLGDIGFTRLQIEVLERDFNKLLIDASIKEDLYLEKFDNLGEKGDIKYCFAICNEKETIEAAEQMEAEGQNSLTIFEKLKVIKNVFGEWLMELDTAKFSFYPQGNASTNSHIRNTKLKHYNGVIEGTLKDFITYKPLFQRYPRLKNLRVRVQKSTLAGNDIKYVSENSTLYISTQVCEDYMQNKTHETLAILLEALQRAILHIEGTTTKYTLDTWQAYETNGKMPYSEFLGRNLTAQEVYDNTYDNYIVKMVGNRQRRKDYFIKKGNGLKAIRGKMLYQPYMSDDIVVFDENGNVITAREYNALKKADEQKLKEVAFEEATESDELEILESSSKDEEDYEINSIETALHRNSNSNKMRKFLKAVNKINKKEIINQLNIKAGSDDLISNVAENAQQAAECFNHNKIKYLSKIPLKRFDTVGRRLSDSLLERFQHTFLKNEEGYIISLYTTKMRGSGGFKHSKLGLVTGTFESARQFYINQIEHSGRKENFCLQEVFVNMKNPLVLNYIPYDDSIYALHDLVDREIMTHREYVRLTSLKAFPKQVGYDGRISKLARQHIMNAGYDGVIYLNNTLDEGSMSVVVFDESQILVVAENGVLQQNNGITDDYFDLTDVEENAKNINNAKNIKFFWADRIYANRVRRRIPDERIKAGSSDFMEHIVHNATEALKELSKNLVEKSNLKITGKDTIGRSIKKSIADKCSSTCFKDKEGNLISFFNYHTRTIDLVKAVKSNMTFGTLNFAISKFVTRREKSYSSVFGIVQEFYINSVAPLIVELDVLDIKALSKQLFERGLITQEEYQNIVLDKCKRSKSMILKRIDIKGYDSIIFVKKTGEYEVMPLNESQIIPVAENGIIKENSEISQTDEINDVFDNDYSMDPVVINRFKKDYVNINAIKDSVFSVKDNTIKMKMFTKVLMCNNSSAIDYSDDRTAGNSGFLEKSKVDVWNARAIMKWFINRDLSNIKIANTDTANRAVSQYQKNLLNKSKIVDNDGKPLSVFCYNYRKEKRFEHSDFGFYVSTLNSAHDRSLSYTRSDTKHLTGFFEEYYAIVKSPYHIMFDPESLTPEMIARYALEEGVITNKEYARVLSVHGANEAVHGTNAYIRLIKILKEKGFDSISFMNERADPGSLGIIVFDKSQLIPVAIDGLPVENSDRTLADSDNEAAFFMPKNNGEDYVEKDRNDLLDNVDDNRYNGVERIKCRNERLEGESHAVTGVPFVRKEIEVDGKVVEVIVPEFDSFFDAQLPKELYKASNRKQFEECYSQLRRDLKNNIELRKRFTEKELESLEKVNRLDNYTWHHDVVSGRMQLVNRYIHTKTGHTGGQYFWGGGTINR